MALYRLKKEISVVHTTIKSTAIAHLENEQNLNNNNVKNDLKSSKKMKISKPVLIISALLILLFDLIVMSNPKASELWFLRAQTWASNSVAWYYMLVVTVYLLFVGGIAISKYGNIRLGRDHDKPEFSYLSWAGMLFSAGIGITLLFFCVSEPLTHLLFPPAGSADPVTQEASRAAMQTVFLHWGLHGWSVFALVGMVLAYFAYRYRLPLTMRSGLYPFIGNRIYGSIGHGVEIFAIVATVVGLSTDMGFGVLFINAGLTHLIDLPSDNPYIQSALVATMMTLAVIVAISGVEKGIKYLSNLNILLACLFLLFILFTGPTLRLLNLMVQNLGDYLAVVVPKSFDLYAHDEPSSWLADWTIFYWAWWISWSPFVGMFIARISKGRTIREFVLGVLFIPLGFTLAWLSIFGNSALEQVLYQGTVELGELAVSAPAASFFQLLESYPMTSVIVGLCVVIGFIFFITSGDSSTVVLSNLSCENGKPDEDGPKSLRVFWGAVIALTTLGLLLAGSVDSLKAAVVLMSLPFSFLLLILMLGLHRALYLEGCRQESLQHTLPPAVANSDEDVLAPTASWRARISKTVHFPTRKTVRLFMKNSVYPAFEEVYKAFEEKGLDVALESTDEYDEIGLKVRMGDERTFRYKVVVTGYQKPSFALNLLHPASQKEQYYRAEVHLIEGSQDYDLLNYSLEQIINDILNQYERHIQYLHLVRES